MNHREIVYKSVGDTIKVLWKEAITLKERSEDPAYPDSYAVEAELEAQLLTEFIVAIESAFASYKMKEEDPLGSITPADKEAVQKASHKLEDVG